MEPLRRPLTVWSQNSPWSPLRQCTGALRLSSRYRIEEGRRAVCPPRRKGGRLSAEHLSGVAQIHHRAVLDLVEVVQAVDGRRQLVRARIEGVVLGDPVIH